MHIQLPKERVLVSGATGLLGKAIAEKLATNTEFDLYCLHRGTRPDIKNVSWINIDLENILDLMEVIDQNTIVIHCAGVVAYDESKDEQIIHDNEATTENVVNACLHKNAKKLVHISSISALGRRFAVETIDEKVLWTNNSMNTVYAKAKYLAEQQAWRGYFEGLPVTILNPSIILGPGDFARSSLTIVDKTRSMKIFYPTGTTGFVDLEDVVALTIKSMDAKHNGERYIVSGESLPYKEVFNAIKSSLGLPLLSKPLPTFMIPIIAQIASLKSRWLGQPKVITNKTLRMSMMTAHYDNSKSVRAFSHTYIPISKTIEKMMDLYKK